jgi:DNA-binding GntR family transcriptional regulator
MTTVDTVEDPWVAEPIGRSAAPLREQVISALRRAIRDFELRPGQRLVERELVESLGVSRTTVREAIRELATEGLVTVVPQKGAIVSSPTLEDATDLYEIRASLESLLVRYFVQRADPAQVGRLARTVDELAARTNASTSIHELLVSKDSFYAVLMEGAKSPALQQLIESIQGRVQVLRATSLSEQGRPLEVVKELRGIVGAVIARDADAASALCADHIRSAARTALAHLRADDEYPGRLPADVSAFGLKDGRS